MSVLSIQWVFWLFATVVVYWILPARFRDPWLAGVSFAFLAFVSPLSATVLSFFVGFTYFTTTKFQVTGPRIAAVSAVIVAVLIYFKLRLTLTFDDFLIGVAIPLGISYYAFRCLHYLIEKYKGQLPAHSFQEFFSYLFFLPTFMTGPIHRFQAFHRDFRRKRWDDRNLSEGLERILYGYVKVTVLANALCGQMFAWYIAQLDPQSTFWVSYLTMLKIGFTGYFLFAGYSDIAIGFALLLGYRVMENFNWPLIRKNVSEFWKSWHISLSSWCREYIYMVVISVTRRPAVAAVVSMLVLGLWHEFSFRYVAWGIYHGLGIAIWQMWQQRKHFVPRLEGPVAQMAYDGLAVCTTFHFVMLGFVIPIQDSFSDTLSIYRNIFLFWL